MFAVNGPSQPNIRIGDPPCPFQSFGEGAFPKVGPCIPQLLVFKPLNHPMTANALPGASIIAKCNVM